MSSCFLYGIKTYGMADSAVYSRINVQITYFDLHGQLIAWYPFYIIPVLTI